MATPVEIAVKATGTAAAARAIGRVESRVGSAGRTLAKGLAIGAAAAGAAMVKLGADSVKSASDAQQSLGATRTVFGRYASEVIRESNRAAKSVGLSANEYRELANVTGAMLTSAGTPLKRTAELTEDLTKRAADMAATFGGTTREAVEAVGSLLRGEADPIERYGVSIKQSDINARLAAKGLGELEGAARKQAEQQARVELLMRQTTKSAGAFNRESNTLAGQQQRLAAGWENVKVKIGNALLPVLTNLVSFTSNTLIPTIGRWWDKLAPAREAIGRFASGVGEIFGLIKNRDWEGAWNVFKSGTVAALRATKDRAKGFITDTLLPAVGNAVQKVRNTWREKWEKFWRDPDKAYNRTLDVTRSFGRRLAEQTAVNIGVTALRWREGSRELPRISSEAAGRTVAAIRLGLRGLPKLSIAIALDVVAGMRRGLSELPGLGGRIVGELRQNITSAGRGAYGWLFSAGVELVAGFAGGIRHAAQDAINAVTGVVEGAKGKAKALLGISSPSRVFRRIGQQTMQGLVQGIEDGRSGVKGAIDRITKLIRDRTDGQLTRTLLKGYRDEYRALTRNGRAQDRVTKRLREARQAMRELRREFAEYARTLAAAVVDSGNITGLGQTGDGESVSATLLIDQLKGRVRDAQRFNDLVRQLTGQGLNQTSIRQLLDAGVSGGLATAEALANGGQAAIDEINTLTSDLAAAGGQLGQDGADALYGAGVEAAEGLIRGLKSRQRQLDRIADRLARRLVRAVRKALKIQSPSGVFADLGKQTVAGMRIGIESGKARQIGEVLARDLTTGFAKPKLTARGVLAEQGGQPPMVLGRIRFTAEQISKMERGREVVADAEFFLDNGGRTRRIVVKG